MLCWSKLTSSPSPVVARSASLARNDGRRRAQRSASLARTYCPTASARQQHGMHCRCVVCAGRGRNFATAQNPQNNRFLSKLEATKTNGPMLMAEGFVFELERRGYVQMGPWSPASILEEREAYKQLHVETLRAGTDIVVACTYYAHAEKLRIIDKQATLGDINRSAIRLAKEANAEVGGNEAVIAGNICNTNIFEPGNEASKDKARFIFREQLEIAAEEGVDCVVAETFSWAEEAAIATEECNRLGLPSIVNMALFAENKQGQVDHTNDGYSVPDCFKYLKDIGATVVGLNCFRGPATTLPLLQQAVTAGVSGPFAAVPMGYRTCDKHVTHWSIEPEGEHFPGLEKHLCDRYEWANFAVDCSKLGNGSSVAIVGTCCGGWVHHIRAMAEALGRTVPASKFSPDIRKHTFLGSDDQLGSDLNKIKIGGVKG